MREKIKVFAPASVANICCGFDVIGFAIDEPGDILVLSKNKQEKINIINHTPYDFIPNEPENNTAGVALISFLKKIDSKQGERIIDVSWAYTGNTGTIVWLEIEAIDRPYLLRDATIAISDNGGNILVAKSVTSSKRIVNLIFQIEISDTDQLDAIIKDSKDIENVFDASRIFPGRK